MVALMDYSFTGAVKPCLKKQFPKQDFPDNPCVGACCQWATCCTLSWRDSDLPPAIAQPEGRANFPNILP